MTKTQHDLHGSGDGWRWTLAVAAVVIVAALALRFGTKVTQHTELFDEPYSIPAIRGIVHDGWSVKTAIDFEETKGPGLIWPYALWGQAFGGDLNSLRWFSIVFWCAGVMPLSAIARMAGVRGTGVVGVAALYVLLPHMAVVGQLVMSEPSFVTGSLCLLWIYLMAARGLSTTADSHGDRPRAGTWWGPMAYGVLLAVLLHNRVHAVAFAGAVCLTAFGRTGWRSWPWWVASMLAGLTRIPLWVRWGGLVSPSNQDRIGIGLRLESLTYLSAGLVPFTAVLLWPVLFGDAGHRRKWLVVAGASAGLLLGVFAMPPLGTTYEVAFAGFVTSAVTAATSSPLLQQAFVSILAMVGVGSIGAIAAMAWSKKLQINTTRSDESATILRLLFWSIVIGWALYGLTYGYVFDRYISPWCVLLPIVWWQLRPRWLTGVQIVGLLGILGYMTWLWLFWGRRTSESSNEVVAWLASVIGA